YWLPGTSASTVIPAGAWEACVTQHPMETGRIAFGVKFSVDGSMVAVSWARAERGGASYVELYEIAGTSGGVAWLADMLLRNVDKIAVCVIDGKSGAAALVQRLKDGGFPKTAIEDGSPAKVQAAASMFIDEVSAQSVSHIASPALDESVVKSVRRAIGKDGFGFGDGAESLSCPVESASLALYGARTTKRNPGRKVRIL
ncbi:hypothetical protein, partial [Gordonibacter sp.]|uniref:hypothetical protein n=1 Tax=Gordonibacter sp. TaxID=1968902 RepID=UPI002FC63055